MLYGWKEVGGGRSAGASRVRSTLSLSIEASRGSTIRSPSTTLYHTSFVSTHYYIKIYIVSHKLSVTEVLWDIVTKDYIGL
jgi:hypothetical protein